MPSRPLTDAEIAEARLVFAGSLDYTHAFVSENNRWPDWVDTMGASLQKRIRQPDDHNAITIGQTSYFPVTLGTGAEAIAAGNLRDIAWLMHELTHQWQYGHLGWSYLGSTLAVQLRLGRMAYNYQGSYPTTEAAAGGRACRGAAPGAVQPRAARRSRRAIIITAKSWPELRGLGAVYSRAALTHSARRISSTAPGFSSELISPSACPK